MRTRSVLVILVALLMVVVTATAEAQRRGGQGGQPGQGGRGQGGRPGQGMFGRGFGGGFGGGGLLGLTRIEAVQKEIEMIDDQVEAVGKLSDEMRQQRPQFDFQGFRDLSAAEREKRMAEMRKSGEEQAKIGDGKLAQILLPHQMDRLKQISIQQQGVRALLSEDTGKKLKVTDAQREKIQASLDEAGQKMREMFQGGGGGGDREQMREKMTAMQKEMADKALASLTADQREEFEEMKGEAFEMPRPEFGRGRGGQGGPGGQQRGGNRPQRPQRPDA